MMAIWESAIFWPWVSVLLTNCWQAVDFLLILPELRTCFLTNLEDIYHFLFLLQCIYCQILTPSPRIFAWTVIWPSLRDEDGQMEELHPEHQSCRAWTVEFSMIHFKKGSKGIRFILWVHTYLTKCNRKHKPTLLINQLLNLLQVDEQTNWNYFLL